MIFFKSESYSRLLVTVVSIIFIFSISYLFKRNKDALPTYKIQAVFSDVSGLSKGGIVTISGHKVGYISNIYLNKQLVPIVTMNIYKNYKLPTDTSVSILSNSLFGKKYIEITPGGMEDFLKDNDTIAFTQSSIDILDLVDKYLSSLKIENKK